LEFNLNENLNKNNNNENYSSIVNLSDYNLTEAQTSLLNKGLKFCPTPCSVDFATARADLDNFHRGLRLYCFFNKDSIPDQTRNTSQQQDHNNITENSDNDSDKFNLTFRNKSTWTPPGPIPLESIITLNEIFLANMEPNCRTKSNLTKAERLAISELKNLTNIVIKPADKGSMIVLLNKSDYVREAEKQLSDEKFYTKTDKDLTSYHMTQIKKVVIDMYNAEYIDDKCKEYLCEFTPRTARFYLLPKIHKNIIPPPGRPIISANNCPTERISQFVDYFINPLVPEIKSYIKDTTDFVTKIHNIRDIPNNTLLVTLDVSSLYTNIPNLEGIRACAKALIKSRRAEDTPPTQFIIQLLKMVLSHNNFEFNGNHYLQIGGTAMGTRLAPSYANLFMADFESKFVDTYTPKPFWWKRYIDDIFVLWTHGEDELHKFITFLNSCHQTIKFTSTISKECVNFLDTTVIKSKKDTLITDLYEKPTDTHSYLHYSSCHPHHTKTGLPYSQFLRIKRICSREVDFIQHSDKLYKSFVQRGYPRKILDTAILKVEQIKREDLLSPKPKQIDKEKPFYSITTYNPCGNLVKNTITASWDLLSRSAATRQLHEKEIIFGYRRNKNLRDLLVSSKIPAPREIDLPQSMTNNKCSYAKCRYCPKIDKSGYIISTTRKRKFFTMTNVTCRSNNLIYCITCKKCQKQYVGQTKRKLMERFQNHFYNVNKGVHQIGRHFSAADHSGIEDIQITILSFLRQAPESSTSIQARNKVEMAWIYRLNTVAPLGLNILD